MAQVDGVLGKPYDQIKAPVFSPDSKSVAYQALQDNGSLMVVENVELGPYTSCWGDTRLAFDSITTLHFLANRNDGLYRVEVTIQPAN